jgi:tRNA threonylcarbamoyladenosine biosynthesis protein TsaB
MLILGLDTATPWGTMALVEDEETIFEVSLKAGKGSGEYLLALLQTLLKKAERSITDLDLISVGTGPGSYTGIRVGLAAAKGLAAGINNRVYGLSTLRIIAENACYASELIAAVMDARRDNIYAALYQNHNGELKNIEAPMIVPAAEFAAKIADLPSVMLCGDGSKVHRTIWNQYANLKIAPAGWDRPLGSIAARIGRKEFLFQTAINRSESQSSEPLYKENVGQLVPCYLRKVEAEVRLEEGRNATSN